MSIATRADLAISRVRKRKISNDDALSLPDFECDDLTEYEPIRLSHKWTIRNFRSIIESKEQQLCLKSGVFASQVAPDVNWRVCIFPRGGNLGGTENAYLFMEVTSTSRDKIFSFKTEHEYIIKSSRAARDYKWRSDVFINTNFLHPDNPILRCGMVHIPLTKIGSWLSGDGSLDICCEMQIKPDDMGIFFEEKSVKLAMDDVSHYINYTSQFKEMYESSNEADCQIICNGEVIKVHKFMLIAHSPVFNAMFEHKKTKEAKKNTIEIVDVELQTLHTMIDYIYSGTIPELLSDDEIIDLIQLADKYDIQSLNHLCQDRLIPRLTKLNVCELLKVSEACKAQSLLDACIRLVAGDLKHIVESKKWSEMKNTYPKLLCHVMKQAIKYES